MSIKVKTTDWRVVTQPWIKTDATTWRKATKVFVKVAGTWMETWPLQPGPVTSVTTSTTYRNDRMEIDVDWGAPVTGEVPAKYIVDVKIGNAPTGPFAYTTSVVVNDPATALTLTNGGNGFHTFANQKIYTTIYAQSAAGRNGDTVSGTPVTVSQLPPPPAPTVYSMTINACAAAHSWTIDTGRRVDGVNLITEFNGVQGAAQTYAKTAAGANYQHWAPNSIGGGLATGWLRTYGPGGVSGWVSVSGTMPSPVTTSGFRFLENLMVLQSISGISPAVRVYLAMEGQDWGYWSDIAAGATSISVAGSASWPRDGSAWTMLLRPINLANGWTGRDQWMGWIRKIPKPYFVEPEYYSQTWRNGAWRTEVSTEYQGASQSGLNTAYFFYGDRWRDQLSAGYLGYTLGIKSAGIGIQRSNTGGQGAAVSPRVIVHRAQHGYGDLSFGGAYDTTALVRNQIAWCPVPTDWIYYMCQRIDGWKGLGLHHGNAVLLGYLGNVSAEYSVYTSTEYGSIEGHPLHTVRVYHDG